ncbi:MAG: hypothetical protein ACEQSX_02720 [Baekduiaceae bacterium]
MTRTLQLARAAVGTPHAQALNVATVCDFALEHLAAEPEAAVEAIRGARESADGGTAMAEAHLASLPADVAEDIGTRAAAAVADQLRIAAASAVAAEQLLAAHFVGPVVLATPELVAVFAATPIVAALRAQVWLAASQEGEA